MKAVDECIMNDVLRKFLLEQKSEVIKMSIYECDQEWEIERLLNQVREETRVELRSEIKEEVRSEVEAETRNETKCELVVSLCDKGFGLEEACELVGITKEQYIQYVTIQKHA